MASVKLTKRAVEAARSGSNDVILWDIELRGFGCKITPAGRRTYFCYYRTKAGIQRRPKIGTHGGLTAEQARGIAQQWLAEVAAGGDPSRDRQQERKSPTVTELCERFLTVHSRVRNKPGTFYNYRLMIGRFILPTLGTRKVGDVTRLDVYRLHHRLRDTPYQANRVLGLISKMMNLAERWDMRPDGTNPARNIEKFRETNRKRYLSSDEMAALAGVLNDAERTGAESPSVIAAIRLLILTGCRLSEILTLRWVWVDLQNGCLNLADSKTGPKTVYLNSAAVGVLAGQRQCKDNPFVIPGAKQGEHLVNLQKPWRRIRERTGLNDLRLHDLRHTYASAAVGLGLGLPVVGKLLGHNQAATTSRYAHLASDPLRAASEKIGVKLVQMLETENNQKRARSTRQQAGQSAGSAAQISAASAPHRAQETRSAKQEDNNG